MREYFRDLQPHKLTSCNHAFRVKWLRAKGYEYKDAVDGRDGVRTFESGGPFE